MRFFARALAVVGHVPEKVTTDGHGAYPRAVRETLGEQVIMCSPYLNNRPAQGHRGIEGHYRPMRGFGSFSSAERFCLAHDEVRDYFRHRTRLTEVVPVSGQPEQFPARLDELRASLEVAYWVNQECPRYAGAPRDAYRPFCPQT